MSAEAAVPRVISVPAKYGSLWWTLGRWDPLRPFLDGKTAPYIFRTPRTDTLVTPVQCKTDLATTKSGNAHHVTAVASVTEADGIRFGARWACGGGSPNILLIADASELGICILCEDKLDPQPVVYRCIDAKFPTILEARLAEAKAIRAENPPCNRQGRAA